MKRSSLFRTIAIIVTTTGLTLSAAAGAIMVYALSNRLPNTSNGQAGKDEQTVKSIASIEKTNSYGLADEYTITYTDNTTSTFVVFNGADGAQGIQGYPSVDGHTPTIEIGAMGTWVIDGVDSGVIASGPRGQDGRSVISIDKTNSEGLIDTYTITYSDDTTSTFIVVNGEQGPQGIQGMPGSNGHTPVISIDATTGNWVVDGTDTGFSAKGPAGQNGLTPHVGQNGNWWIGETDTGVKAEGQNGQNGASVTTGNGAPASGRGNVGDTYIDLNTGEIYDKTENGWEKQAGNSGFAIPHIGTNGNWWVGENDTGIAATGPQGPAGRSIVSVEKTYSDGNVDTYTITYSDNTYSYFYVTNGTSGTAGAQGVPGTDGHTPVIIIGSNGNWFIDGVDTGVAATGPQGNSGQNGVTPHIGENGNWWIGETDTGVKAQGQQGEQGQAGQTPYIGTNGNWWVGDQDLGVASTGPQGNPGQNGNSVLTGDTAPDNALGSDGDSYINLNNYDIYTKEAGAWVLKGNLKGQNGQDGRSIVSIDKTGNNGLIDEYTITYSDGTTSLFYVINGQDGATGGQGIQGVPGADGHTPVIEIGSNGNWVIDGTDTGIAAQGPQGVPGQDGTSMRTGIGAPTDALGQNGDSYIDLDTWNFYVKDNGTWTLKGNIKGAAGSQGGQGEQGNPGQNGSSVLTGAGAPEADNGEVGDSYIDTLTWDFYVKTNTGWGTPVGNIKGGQGNPGTSITVTSVEKTNTEGLVDTYTITFSDGSTATFTVTNGAEGQQGQAGNNGKTLLTGIGAPAVDQGVEGDSYVDVQNWIYYVKTSEGWQNKGSFKGSDGTNGNNGVSITNISYTSSAGLVDTYTITFSNGLTTTFTVTNGANGTNGNTLITGSVDPTTEGVNGDSYLNTTTWEYFVKEADAWVSKGTIKGDDGATGPAGANGTSVKTGSGAPADDFGSVGDSYIDIDTWNFYVKTDTGWGTPVGNIHNSPNTFTVTYNSNGGSSVDANDSATEGKTITAPSDPTKDGYYFQGWYTAEGNKWNFEKDVITDNITLYAHWAQFKVENGFLTGCSIDSGDIVIPEFFDDQLVTKIGEEVFKGKTGITSVTIPHTITEIGESAFEGCTGLTSFFIPNNVKTIGDKAFKDCANLAYVYMQESQTTRSSTGGIETIGAYAFQNCGLKALVIPQSVKSIGQGAFQGEKGWTIFNNVKEMYSPTASSIAIGPDDTYMQANPNVGDIFIETNNSLVWVYNADGSWHSADQLQLYNIINSGNGAPTTDAESADFNEVYLDLETGNMYVNSTSKLESISLPFVGGNADGSNGYLGYIFGASDASENNSYVPHSLANVTITGDYAIAENAMSNCQFVETIDITGDPSSIGFGAFKDCNSLKSISIPFIGSTPTLPELKYGTGAPSASLSGSMYVDTASQDVYINNGSGWTRFNNLTDITGGEPFAFGHGVPTGAGTFYFDLDTGGLYIYQPSGWMYGANIGDMLPSSATYFTVIFGDDKSGPFNLPYSLTKVIVTKGNGENRDIIPSNAFADQYSIKEYIISNGIREIGANAFKSCYELKSISLPNSITKIGDHAFEDCYGLESIILPTSLKVIGIGAFMNCNDLQTLYIPEGVTEIGHQAFKECSDLRYVYLPNTLLTIGNEAFASCDDLESIVIPDSVTFINKYAFVYCSSLKSITVPFIGSDPIGGNDTGDQTIAWLFAGNFPSTLKTITVTMGNGVNRDQIPEEAFANCNDVTTINLPNNIKTIGDRAFQYAGIEFLILPGSVSSVGNQAFEHCNNLTSIVFQEGANKTFGQRVFYQCTHLKSVVINGQLSSIGTGSFNGCSALEYISLGVGLTSISDSMFFGLTNLKTVIIPQTVTSIGTSAFAQCSSLKTIKLPNVTSIGITAFYGCTSLEEMILPNTVTSIGDRAFYYCSSLKYLELNEGLTSIGIGAFAHNAITNLIIPSTVTSIGADAFALCSNLISVYMEEGPAITIGGNAFGSCSALKTFIIKSDIASFGNQILAGSTALEYAALGEGLTEVSECLFNGFTELKGVVLPSSITSIAAQAFHNCSSLETIVLPNGVTKIGSRAFSGCTSLSSVTFGNSLKTILEYAFENCSSLTEVTLPASTRDLARGVFSGCNNLTSLTMPFIGGIYDAIATPVLTGTLADNELPATGLGSDNSIYIDTAHAKIYRKIDGVWYYQFSVVDPGTSAPANIHTGTTNDTPTEGVNDGDYYINLTNGNMYFHNGGSWVNERGGVSAYFAHFGYLFLESTGSSQIGQFYTSVPTSLKTLTINGAPTKFVEGCLNGVQLETLSIPYIGSEPNQSDAKFGILFVNISSTSTDYNSFVSSSLKNVYVTGDYNIPANAFNGCANIESIALEGNYANAGASLFNGCTSLKSLTLHHLMSDFDSCFTSSTAPESLKVLILLNGTGANHDELSGSLGCCKYVETVIVPTNIKTIGDSFFSDCESLKNFVIPEGVTTIGMMAFSNCKSLTSIVVPDSVTSLGAFAFGNDTKLTYVKLGSGLTEIPIGAFYGCVKLQNVEFGDITAIGQNAFTSCESLTSFVAPSSLMTIGQEAFAECRSLAIFSFPYRTYNSVTSIGQGAFKNCYALVYCNMSDCIGVTTIESETFSYCKSLQFVEISYNVTNIKNNAFEGCKSLSSLTIGTGLTTIGNSAFSGCTNLVYVDLKNVQTIGSYAFEDCGLKVLVVPQSVTAIGQGAFNGCNSLQSITIPFVGGSANGASDQFFGYIFGYSNYNNQKNFIPASLKIVKVNGGNGADGDVIPTYSFKGCEIEYVILSNNIKTIGDHAFENCSSLKNITIRGSITTIGDYAFSGCKELVRFEVTFSWFNKGYATSGATTPDSGTGNWGDYYYCTSNNKLYEKNQDFGAWFEYSDSQFLTGSGAPTDDQGNLKITYIDLTTHNVYVKDSFLTSIGAHAFDSCISMKTADVPYTVTTIKASAFSGCSSLTEFYLPRVTVIEDETFFGCTSLQYVDFSNAEELERIGVRAFCVSGIKYLGIYSYVPVVIDQYAFHNCSNLTQVNLNYLQITSIGDHAFDNCSNLLAISTEGSLIESIGERAFMCCTSLESISFENGLEFVGGYAFMYCENLKSVVLPSSLVTNSECSFYGCYSLESMTIPFTGKSATSNTSFVYIFGGSVNDIPSSLKTVIVTGNASSNGIADYAFRDCSNIENIILKEGIKTIGSRSFENCTGLTSFVIPDAITSIGQGAFQGCSNLKSMTIPFVGGSANGASDQFFGYIFGASSYSNHNTYIPASLKTVIVMGGNGVNGDTIKTSSFRQCGIEQVILPNGIKTIGSFAFMDCVNLTSIVLPNTVTSIGQGAFQYCSSLTTAAINSGVTSIGQEAFRGCRSLTSIVIPNSVTSIGSYAFYNCQSLAYVTLPNNSSFIKIADDLFYGCKSLNGIIIPNSVTSIGNSAFSSCVSLQSIVISQSVESIGNSAFSNCKLLRYIVLPSSVTSIGQNAFNGCESLEALTIPFVGTTASDYQFLGSIFGGFSSSSNSSDVPASLKTVVVTGDDGATVTSLGNNAFNGCANIETIIVGNGIATLGENAFANCKKLRTIRLADSVTSIGDRAFSNCTNLRTVDFDIYSNITNSLSIGVSAFQYCSSLQSVSFPQLISSIGDYAFQKCEKLETVSYSKSSTFISIGKYAFQYCYKLKEIILPFSLKTIGESAFQYCSSLLSLDLRNVETIDYLAFAGCNSVQNIIIDISKTTYIEQYAFGNCDSVDTVIVYGTTGSISDRITSYTNWFGHGNIYSSGNGAIAYNPATSGAATLGARFIFKDN